MKSNELRIGNYVDWNGENGIISQILEQEVCFKCGEDCLITDIKGILLTEEWLIKFNFTKGIDKVYFIKTKNGYLKVFEKIAHVLISIDKYSNCFKISDNIKYAHQLQNLYFALTGKELTLR